MTDLDNRAKLLSLYYETLEKNIGDLPEYDGFVYRYEEDKDLFYVTRILKRVDDKGELVIPYGFDYMDESVTFLNKKNLKYLDLGTIREIKFNTTKFPKSLVSVKGDNVKSLGTNTFADLYALKSVDMKNLVSIGKSCFSGCKSLKEITINKVTLLEDYAFLECEALTVLNFESLEISSASDVFSYSGLVHFTAKNLISLDDSFFANAHNLEWVYTPNLSSLGKGLFRGCLRLKYCELGTLDISLFNNYLTNVNYLDENKILSGKDVYDVYTRNSNELFLLLPSMFSVNTFLKADNVKFVFRTTDFELAELIVQFITLAYITRSTTGGTLTNQSDIRNKFLSCYKQGKFMGLKNIRFEIKILR